MKLSDWNGNTYDTKDGEYSIQLNKHGKYYVDFLFKVWVKGPLVFHTKSEAIEWLNQIRREEDERNSDTPNP